MLTSKCDCKCHNKHSCFWRISHLIKFNILYIEGPFLTLDYQFQSPSYQFLAPFPREQSWTAEFNMIQWTLKPVFHWEIFRENKLFDVILARDIWWRSFLGEYYRTKVAKKSRIMHVQLCSREKGRWTIQIVFCLKLCVLIVVKSSCAKLEAQTKTEKHAKTLETENVEFDKEF